MISSTENSLLSITLKLLNVMLASAPARPPKHRIVAFACTAEDKTTDYNSTVQVCLIQHSLALLPVSPPEILVIYGSSSGVNQCCLSVTKLENRSVEWFETTL